MKPNKFIIEKQVSEFRMDNGLSATEPITLKSLLLKLNILTVFRLLSDNFSGMCLKDNSEHRFMLINSNQTRGRQHFTIAHELYHLYIEKKPTPHKCNPGCASKDPIEQCADMFASSLLMPEGGICQLIPEMELKTKNISMATVLKLEHYFSCSNSLRAFSPKSTITSPSLAGSYKAVSYQKHLAEYFTFISANWERVLSVISPIFCNLYNKAERETEK